jgi:Lipocalin-like domain
VDRAKAFVGTWDLVEYRLIRADGAVRKPWGDHVAGLLIYSYDGHMSATLMPSVRRKAAPPETAASPETMIGATDMSRRSARCIAYAGTFSVDAETIIHHVEVSVFPRWVGLPQVRYYEVSESQLILKTPPILRLGKHLVGQLTWRRLS